MKRFFFWFIFIFSVNGLAQNQCAGIFLNLPNSHLRDNTFATNRNLENYQAIFNFEESLSLSGVLPLLGEKSVWVDMGAGKGNAILEGLRKYENLEGVAITYVRPENSVNFLPVQGRITELTGDYVEVMNQKGRLEPWKNRTSLITDVYGPLSYTVDVSRVLQVYMDLLKPGGLLMFNFDLAREMELVPRDSISHIQRMNDIKFNGYAGRVGFYNWLLSIPGIQLMSFETHKVPGTKRSTISASVKLMKIENSVQIPQLKLIEYHEDKPSRRVFEAN